MIHYNVDITVNRPTADVFPFLADVTRHPSWMGGSTAVPISDGPMRPGYRYRHSTDEGELEIEVTDFEPGVRLSARTVDGPYDWAGTFQLGPEAEGSRVISTGAIRLTGWKRLAEPFLGREVQRREQQELVRLKAIVESGQV
ncbi:MAG TPA: SRPBCC family protein [Candidatus Limnocylindria bacterium]|nr:SRPBCC family protein [Candidatus Limnocylindria bacterium]